ncbi:MAG: UbiA family prenyltransferase [Desulfobacteraceae bacterium]
MPFSPPTAALNIGRNLKLFFALSRTPHALIDLATPAAAALLCLGHLPSFSVTVVGIITMFAGYTAVYALNDVVDLKIDKEKVRIGGCAEEECYLDGAMTRHPIAKGALSLSDGLAWIFGWAVVALAGAYWLNPVCLYIFLAGCVLESIYCLLWQVTPLRTLVNGVVKTLGAVAAVYAVHPAPPLLFLVVLFMWIFFWEIGGQNIPCDWTDIEEDRHFKAKTIPVHLGARRAGLISVATLVCAMFLHFILFWASPLIWNGLLLLAAVGVNIVLLLWPAFKLADGGERRLAMDLFNKASYYPLATLILVLIQLAIA